MLTHDRKIVVQAAPSKRVIHGLNCDPLTLLPAFGGPVRRRRPMPLRGGLRDSPVPIVCWECGKALAGNGSDSARTTVPGPFLSTCPERSFVGRLALSRDRLISCRSHAGMPNTGTRG
jgi:hypothetical protein